MLVVALTLLSMVALTLTAPSRAGAADTTVPSTPTAVSAVAAAAAVTLRWQPSTDDVGVRAYVVHRDGRYLASVRATTIFTDRAVVSGRRYRYQVRAKDAAGGLSIPSASLTVVAAGPPADLLEPSVPKELRGRADAAGVTVQWAPSSDDVGVSRYLVLRDGLDLAATASTEYRDDTVAAGARHRYQVRAQDAAGNTSGESASLTVRAELEGAIEPPRGELAGLLVTTWGDDGTADGSAGHPFGTIGAAVRAAVPGGTVYVDGGTYRETVVVARTSVSLRAVPGTAPVISGADVVTNWTEAEDRWWAQGPTLPSGTWPLGMTSSARSSLGQLMVVDGVQLRQVTSAAELSSSTFWVDGTDRAWIGSDPGGHTVEVATRTRGLLATEVSGFLVEGITFRHHAASPGDMGALELRGDHVVLRNVRSHDNANAGIRIIGSDAVLDTVQADHNGRIGATLHQADRARIGNGSFDDNNTEGFQTSGAAGGIKLTASRDVEVDGPSANRNLGHGIWFDLSSVGLRIADGEASDNSGNGILVEVSASAVVTGNTAAGNRRGIAVIESNDVVVTDNLVRGNETAISLLDGYRDGQTCTDREIGAFHVPPIDKRFGCQWPTVKWDLDTITLSGNTLVGPAPSGTGSANRALLEINHVADPARDIGHEDRRRSAEAMQVQVRTNRFVRQSAAMPRFVVGWARWPASMAAFQTLEAFQVGTGQGAGSTYAGL